VFVCFFLYSAFVSPHCKCFVCSQVAPRSASLTPGGSFDGGPWQDGSRSPDQNQALEAETSSATASTVLVRSSGKDSDDRRGAWALAAMNSVDDGPTTPLAHDHDEGSDSVARPLSGVNPIALQGKGETYVVGIVDILQECVFCHCLWLKGASKIYHVGCAYVPLRHPTCTCLSSPKPTRAFTCVPDLLRAKQRNVS